ncbi:MAG: stage V sporulation protein AE [Bacillota bacterium]|nr:stage V sporulation protein AE [Bacillota bacterium]
MDYLKAFVTGGVICIIAQILIDKTKMTPARIVVLFVSLGVVLTGIGVYGKIVDFGGAGATVPIIGFGYALAEGVKKGVEEKGLLGILAGGVTATSAGIAAAICFGYIAAILGKSETKK